MADLLGIGAAVTIIANAIIWFSICKIRILRTVWKRGIRSSGRRDLEVGSVSLWCLCRTYGTLSMLYLIEQRLISLTRHISIMCYIRVCGVLIKRSISILPLFRPQFAFRGGPKEDLFATDTRFFIYPCATLFLRGRVLKVGPLDGKSCEADVLAAGIYIGLTFRPRGFYDERRIRYHV